MYFILTIFLLRTKKYIFNILYLRQINHIWNNTISNALKKFLSLAFMFIPKQGFGGKTSDIWNFRVYVHSRHCQPLRLCWPEKTRGMASSALSRLSNINRHLNPTVSHSVILLLLPLFSLPWKYSENIKKIWDCVWE